MAPTNWPRVHKAAPRFSGEEASFSISSRMLISSRIHSCNSRPPPVTAARSPIVIKTDKTTPGFGSGSRSLGTKTYKMRKQIYFLYNIRAKRSNEYLFHAYGPLYWTENYRSYIRHTVKLRGIKCCLYLSLVHRLLYIYLDRLLRAQK